jgi:hypothetical protein
MKVNELFEAVQGEPGQGGKLKHGAYYKPQYDADEKILRGSVQDWLDASGITKDDIAKAMEIMLGTGLIQKMAEAGLKLKSTPRRDKNGTFTFEVDRKYPKYEYERGTRIGTREAKTRYVIHANGQIRHEGEGTFAPGITRLASPKPRLKAGDPVGSLVMIYTQAMEEVLKKWKKAAAKQGDTVKEDNDAGLYWKVSGKLDAAGKKQFEVFVKRLEARGVRGAAEPLTDEEINQKILDWAKKNGVKV